MGDIQPDENIDSGGNDENQDNPLFSGGDSSFEEDQNYENELQNDELNQNQHLQPFGSQNELNGSQDDEVIEEVSLIFCNNLGSTEPK